MREGTYMAKNTIFIGSSSENIVLAEAIQLNLSKINGLKPICWNQGIFKISNYPLEDLITQLKSSAFGIFILGNDDFIISRNKKYVSVRDNVLFEMGMFIGVLGRNRTYFLVPKGTEIEYKIPSDLSGINYAQYGLPVSNTDIDAVIGPACTEIKRRILEQMETALPNIVINKFGIFPEFDDLYKDLFEFSSEITTSFIHSRRWRENNLVNIDNYFKRAGVKWNIILPNIKNNLLVEHLKQHFNDGDTLKSKILDAYIYFAKYQKKFPKKVFVYLYDLYPTYSFYKFDNKLIVSFYPLTDDRRPTPTLQIDMDTKYADFYQEDINTILSTTTSINLKNFDDIIEEFRDLLS